MYKLRSLLLWVALTACLRVAFGQPTRTTYEFDTSNMKVTVSLDRQTYLPGEVAQVTLEVSNPAGVSVTTLKPFDPDTGCINWYPYCGSAWIVPANTTTFSPGETRKVVLNSFDETFDSSRPVMEGGGVPTKPGEYPMTYRYGTTRAQAKYIVASAQLEAEAIVRLPDVTISHDAPSPPYTVPSTVHVVALRSEGISYICVPQAQNTQTTPVATKEVMATKPSFDHQRVNTGEATPFRRVATSRNSIVSLSATGDLDGNLTIQWTDSTGVQGHYYYPASYPAFKH
jgi:hypothetical protein